MINKKYCKAIGKNKRPCHRFAIFNGYCALHQRQKDRGKIRKPRKDNALERFLRGENDNK